MRKVKKTKAKKTRKAARAPATKVASKRAANATLIVKGNLKTALAQRAKAAGFNTWKGFATSQLESLVS